jgi:serine protease Do
MSKNMPAFPRPITRMKATPTLSFLLGFVFSCSVPFGQGLLSGQEPPRTADPAPGDQSRILDDSELFNRLNTEGRRLVETKATASNLNGQLSRHSCSLRLPRTAALKRDIGEATQRVEDSVVIVAKFLESRELLTFSGFIMTESGAVATCYHGVASVRARGFVVMTRDGVLHPVREVLAASEKDDLVILQIEGKALKALPICTNAPVGTTVAVLSHPCNNYYVSTTGRVSRYFRDRRRTGNPVRMTITAAFGDGSSGAPVLNDAGEVVGVASSAQFVGPVDGEARHLSQMVLYNCSPAPALLDLISSP